MKTYFILFSLFCFMLTSCQDKGKIKVENKLHNTKLENISFGDVSVFSSLLPGETSTEVTVVDCKESFPKVNQLDFYMESNGNKVYLKTKYNFSLDAGQTLLIIISDTTKVVNPLLE
ncbi:MAG: hypothetical protein Q8907_16560 [Bacteroidota bacterium]|nr:hypothetical protein [Bacteroidota bacterium]MDP4227338.1 hypothetical protein [Bacteroidota bacterium]MDP4275881.1 hypothetical protein [Bacteroidota bacterium]